MQIELAGNTNNWGTWLFLYAKVPPVKRVLKSSLLLDLFVQ